MKVICINDTNFVFAPEHRVLRGNPVKGETYTVVGTVEGSNGMGYSLLEKPIYEAFLNIEWGWNHRRFDEDVLL